MSSDDSADFVSYYRDVRDKALELGFNRAQILIFFYDIEDYYNDGKSVDECVNEVF